MPFLSGITCSAPSKINLMTRCKGVFVWRPNPWPLWAAWLQIPGLIGPGGAS